MVGNSTFHEFLLQWMSWYNLLKKKIIKIFKLKYFILKPFPDEASYYVKISCKMQLRKTKRINIVKSYNSNISFFSAIILIGLRS